MATKIIWEPPFRVHSAGRHSTRSPDYCFDTMNVATDPHRVLVKRTISGEGVLVSYGKRHALPAGTLFAIERPGPHLYRYEENGAPWHFEYLSLRCSTSHELLPNSVRSSPIFSAPAGSFLERIMKELIDAHFSGAGDRLETAELAYRFYLEMIGQRGGGRPESGIVEQVRSLIESNYGQDIRFSEVASDLSVTPEGLCRSFKAAYGTPPGKYLLQVRIRHARQLLEQGELTLKEISDRCGFSCANYFGRCFKRALDTTPANYRRRPTIS